MILEWILISGLIVVCLILGWLFYCVNVMAGAVKMLLKIERDQTLEQNESLKKDIEKMGGAKWASND